MALGLLLVEDGADTPEVGGGLGDERGVGGGRGLLMLIMLGKNGLH